jgi:anti-sigma B factor antagonist
MDNVGLVRDPSMMVPGAHRGQEGRMADDPERFQAEALRIETQRNRSGVTIVLAGEFDLAGTERFRTFVSDALAADPKAVTIDASGLDFIDSSGLQALLRARDAATGAGVTFRVSDASPALRRMFELFGVEDLLTDG